MGNRGPEHDQHELQIGAQRLGFRWAMLLGVLQMDWHPLPTSNSLQRAAQHHAKPALTLLHARAIYDFLFADQAATEEVRAVHFMRGSERAEWDRDRTTNARRYCPSLAGKWEALTACYASVAYRENSACSVDPETIVAELKWAFKAFGTFLGTEFLTLQEGLLINDVNPNEVLG